MRHFETLLIILLGLAIYKANAQTNVIVNDMKANTGIVVNESAATDLGRNKVLIDTGNRNLLKNASFEGAVDSSGRPTEWSCTGAISSFSREEVPSPDGKYMASMTCLTGICECFQEVETKHNLDGKASIYALENSLLTGAFFFVKIDDDLEYKQELEGPLKKYSQPIIGMGNNKARIGIRIDATSESKRVFFDDALLSYGIALEYTKFDSDSVEYTPELSGFTPSGTNAINYGRWRRDGENMEITILTRMGSTGTVTPDSFFTWKLPSGYEVDTTRLPPDTAGGRVRPGASFWYRKSETQWKGVVASYDFIRKGIWLQVTNAGAPTNVGSAVVQTGSDDVFSIQISLPIKGWKSSVAMASQATNYYNLKEHSSFSFTVDGGPTTPVLIQKLPFATDLVRVSPGVFDVKFPSLTAKPFCVGTAVNTSGAWVEEISGASTTTGYRFTIRGTGGAGNLPARIICEKQGQDAIDAFRTEARMAIKESNIIYDRDEFHLDERDTGRIYSGKKIYKKCISSPIPVVATGVDRIVSQYGTCEYSAGRWIPVYYNNGGEYFYLQRDVSNQISIVRNICSTNTSMCVEYTKL